MLLAILLLGFTTRAIQAHPDARTIYVNGSNTGIEDGTQAHPEHRTIAKAVENVASGDTGSSLSRNLSRKNHGRV